MNTLRQQRGSALFFTLAGVFLFGILSVVYVNESMDSVRMSNALTNKDQAIQVNETGARFVESRFHAAVAPVNDLNANSTPDLEEAYTSLIANPSTLPLSYAYTDSTNAHKPLQVLDKLKMGIESGVGCTLTGQDVASCASLKPNDLFTGSTAPLLFVVNETGLQPSTNTWTTEVAPKKVMVFIEYTIAPSTPSWVNLHLVSVSQVENAVSVDYRFLGSFSDPVNYHVAPQYANGL